jgi:hypothetical protein
MTVIAVVAVLLGLLVNPQQISLAAETNEVSLRTPRIAVPDDSLKSQRKASRCDPEALRASSNMFASWTRDRIQGYNIHELDSLELRRIGLVVADDGTVWRTKGNTAEGMQEVDGRNITRWFIQGVFKATNPVDSARLAQEFQKGEAEAKRTGVNHPIQVAEEINVEPVLVTNSRGYTFSHTCDINNPGDPSAIGSGKYKGRELVAIRVPYKGIPMPADTAGYFYIYWYEPSDEFLSLLPSHVREEIARRKEALRTEVVKGAQATGGLAASSLHPNPVTQDAVTVDYTLREARGVALTMYDINGSRVLEVSISEQRAPGSWQDSISLIGIPDGYYFLGVTTDKGEQNIHPMVLKR